MTARWAAGGVPGSAILIGGNPGAQINVVAANAAQARHEQMKTLYVTGGNRCYSRWRAGAHRLGLRRPLIWNMFSGNQHRADLPDMKKK
ncbi:hypothetical protein KCP73_08430 [Salmonella enterica subsp. enterica]|nr:hypothetical protein KCP73_08430 [Salmonella enterica subsp. enterica]